MYRMPVIVSDLRSTPSPNIPAIVLKSKGSWDTVNNKNPANYKIIMCLFVT